MALVQDELVAEHGGQTIRPVMIWDDDEEDTRPVVMVCGTILGRNNFVIDRAKALQKLGYIGVALDLYCDGLSTDDVDVGRHHMGHLLSDREELRRRLDANIKLVAAQPNVNSMKMAVIGYCFGGLCALDVARTRDDVQAVASFHGSLIPPPQSLSTPINAKVLILHGNEDPLVPPEQVDAVKLELTEREADWQLHAYGFTYHSFAIPTANAPEKGLQFNDRAQQRSWLNLLALLNETF